MSASLSEISQASSESKEMVQLVVFSLAGCELGVGIRQVREIIRVSEIAIMPKAPRFLEGIINLRGKIVPVLDLKRRFEMPLVERTTETRILVVEIKDQTLGLMVDKVVEVLKINTSLIEPATETVLTMGVEFINGLIHINERLILLFKLEKIFTFEEIKALPEWDASSKQEKK